MFVVLLVVVVVVGNIATSAALSGVNLDCTNDFEYRMSCHFDAPNCTDYNVTLWSLDGETYCLPMQCASGKCCCSIHLILILMQNHTAFVRRGGEYVESKNISVKYSFKPQTPTIVSVNETNGNFPVIWRTNIKKNTIREMISTRLTYRKKGETQEMTELVQAALMEERQCYLCFTTDILGAHLEPSTTYVVTVQNVLPWESQPSDHSKEYEFTTPASRKSRLLALIVSLSLLSITITSAAYVCYVKCRAKYWDSVSNQNSKLLHLNPSKAEVLKPMPPIISPIYVEALTAGDLKSWSKGSLIDSSTESLLQSSGINSGPPSLGYPCTEAADIIAGVQDALSKAFMNIIPALASTNHLLKESGKPTCNNEQHSGLENAITYSFIRPSCPVQVTPDALQSHAQPEPACQCEYQDTGLGSTCDGSTCEENMIPTLVSSYSLSATSQQRSSRDSGRFSNSENSGASLSCSNASLSGDVESRTEAGHESCRERFEDAAEKGQGLICVPASLQGNFPVDENYQAFRGWKELSDGQFEEQKSANKQDFNKVLENDSLKGDACFNARSNHSFLVDDGYQAFQGLRKLSDSQVGEQNSGDKEDLKKTFENPFDDFAVGDTSTPAQSNPSFSVDDSYQAFHDLRGRSDHQVGEKRSVEKENLVNYQVCCGLRELPFNEQNSEKNNLGKFLQNYKDATKGNTCVPVNPNPNIPTDDNYLAFHGLRQHSDNKVGEPNGGEKEDPGKVLQKDARAGVQCSDCVPESFQDSLPMEDNYQVVPRLKK
ncbi:uncharacterized protein LOC144050016 isoform X2 [Vanacampus margaritifer]